MQDLELEVSSGTVVVSLPEPRGTGHRWVLAGCPEGVVPLGDHGSTPSERPPVPGRAGSRTFRFEISSPGRYDVDFELRRSWGQGPADNCRVRLKVRPAA
jgi:predicted secreted protein